MRFKMVLATFAALMIAAPVRGDDAAPKQSDNRIQSTPEERKPAGQIDFNAELQVPLQALSHLGTTIEEAREEADPVCIASAANILAAAEALAGERRAALTSDQLWTEAIALAELRKSSAELAALAQLASGDRAADLRERSDAAKTEEEAKKKAAEAGETSKSLWGELHVINETHEYVHLYVDGRHVGDVYPHGQFEIHLHDAFHLVARSHYHMWHTDIYGHEHHYDWILHDPHHPHHFD